MKRERLSVHAIARLGLHLFRNRAVAIAMAEGPAAGLALLEGLPLERYQWFHSTRADFLRREGKRDEAASAYRRALELAANETERAFLERRLAEL